MKLKILSIGKISKSPYVTISNHYIKSIQSISKQTGITDFTVSEFNKSADKNTELRKQKEFELIKNKITIDNSVNILLDEHGKSLSTMDMKLMIEKYTQGSKNELNFIIGGPDGASDLFSEIITEKISLSSMTLPHLLARILLLEQIFRSLTILINHPYHRE